MSHRVGEGWDLTSSHWFSGLLEHLREIAFSPAYPHLWSTDTQDMLSLYDERSVVRVRGVEFVFHNPVDQ